MRKRKKVIHVNQHNIRHNIKNEADKPVITVKSGKQNIYGYNVKIHGESEVIYPEKQLSCGARVWIQTFDKVTVYDRDNQVIGEIE